MLSDDDQISAYAPALGKMSSNEQSVSEFWRIMLRLIFSCTIMAICGFIASTVAFNWLFHFLSSWDMLGHIPGIGQPRVAMFNLGLVAGYILSSSILILHYLIKNTGAFRICIPSVR